MITNTDITIYNAVIDRDDGVSSYKKTHIYGVNWQQTMKSTVGDKGLNAANVIKIFIPFLSIPRDKTYLKPRAYNSCKNKDNYFTLNENDIVVKGIVNDDIVNASKFKNSHDDVVTVLSVSTLDYGSPSMRHWEVGAS